MSTTVNDAKRAQMAIIASRPDWTTAQLAALMGVSSGTVCAWRRGRSMGTNAQRARLAKLGTPAEEVPNIAKEVATLAAEADRLEQELKKDAAVGALHVHDMRRKRVDRIFMRTALLRKLFLDTPPPIK